MFAMRRTLRSEPANRPNTVLKNLVMTGVELIHARDAALGAALAVAPPSVEPAVAPVGSALDAVFGDKSGILYRSMRKVFRWLMRVELLRSPMLKLRDRIRQRR